MNANKQDAGGLPEPVWFNIRKGGHHLILFPAKGYSGVMLDPYMEMVKSAHDDVIDAEPLYTADQIRAYGEQCRAASGADGMADELGRLAYFIEGLSVFVNSRERIKQPEGAELYAEACKGLRAIEQQLRALSRGVTEGK